MNGHHRTPEEIAQIVKVSPTTIKRRLLEFAQTDMARKTVDQWKSMTDDDLKAPGESQPPVVKAQIAREAKRRRLGPKGRSSSRATTQADEEQEPASDDEGRQMRTQIKQSQMQDAIQAAVAQLDGLGEEEEEEADLAPPAPGEYVRELDAAGDNPEEAANERARAIKKFKRANKFASSGAGGDDDDLEDLQEEIGDIEEEEGQGQEEGDKEEGDQEKGDEEDEGLEVQDPRMRYVKFEQWDDPEAVRKEIEKKYMPKLKEESALTDKHMEDRLSLWLGARDPKEVMYEFECVGRALKARDDGFKFKEQEFEDIDDEEIDSIWRMDEDEQRIRARMWLSHNGKWLEEDKGELLDSLLMIQLTMTEKQWRREQYESTHADKIARRVSCFVHVVSDHAADW
jgi:transcription factor IIIB subunit 2